MEATDNYILERIKPLLSKTYTIDALLLDASRGHKEVLRQREKSLRQYHKKREEREKAKNASLSGVKEGTT